MSTKPPVKHRIPKAVVVATEESLDAAAAEYAARDSRLQDVIWEYKTTDDDRLIKIGHCPCQEGDDLNLMIGIGAKGPYIKCFRESCDVAPALAKKPRKARAKKAKKPKRGPADFDMPLFAKVDAMPFPDVGMNGQATVVTPPWVAEPPPAPSTSWEIVPAPAGPTDNGRPPPQDPGGWVIPPDEFDTSLALTDLGNARTMARLFGDRIRYCHPWKTWFIWDNCRWRKDDVGAINSVARLVVKRLYQAAELCGDQQGYEALQAWAYKSSEKKLLNAMVELARSEQGIAVRPEDLDRDDWALNVLDGTIDLKTGGLRPHRKEDLITKLAPVVYGPGSPTTRFVQFEKEIFPGEPEPGKSPGDTDLILYVRRTVGIALNGADIVQELNIWHGAGANGKNVYLNLILEMLGDYAMIADPDLLLVTGTDRHPTGVADLCGKRCVFTSETEDGRQMAVALMKRLTGDAKIKARHMREDFFEFRRTFKLFHATNPLPEVTAQDHATWRRIRRVPFNVTFVDPTIDSRPISPPRCPPGESPSCRGASL
jgi:P4 family phage/plasmid primase-like protien